MNTFAHLFTPRQLVALTTFSDLVQEARTRIIEDVLGARASRPPRGAGQRPALPGDDLPLRDGGSGATAYAEAVGVYLAFAVDYAANYWSTVTTPAEGFIRGTFARQALPMTWDYAEAPPFGHTSGNWIGGIKWISKALAMFPQDAIGSSIQADASSQYASVTRVVSTDPPYYDNIGYADLSDFFYVWLRRSLQPTFPDLFATLALPNRHTPPSPSPSTTPSSSKKRRKRRK